MKLDAVTIFMLCSAMADFSG